MLFTLGGLQGGAGAALGTVWQLALLPGMDWRLALLLGSEGMLPAGCVCWRKCSAAVGCRGFGCSGVRFCDWAGPC
jgi:hypothetical protein